MSQFNCSTSNDQETQAMAVQAAMQFENLNGHEYHAYVQHGFDIFSHTENGKTHTLNSLKITALSWNLLVNEINSGRPFLLGFPNYNNGGAHMTVCAGYEIEGTNKYLYLSDNHTNSLVKWNFKLSDIDSMFQVLLITN